MIKRIVSQHISTPFFFKKQGGFTLIEIIIVIGVIAALSSITMNSYISYQKSTELREESTKIISNLREAQNLAVSMSGAEDWGLHLDQTTGENTIFKGVWNPAGANNRKFFLSKNVEFQNISLNSGGNNIIFNKLDGKTNTYGLSTINGKENAAFKIVKKDDETFSFITITPEGKVELYQ